MNDKEAEVQKFAGLTHKEFLALPMEERNKRLIEQSQVAPSICKDCRWNKEHKSREMLTSHFCSHPSVFSEEFPLTVSTDRNFTECDNYEPARINEAVISLKNTKANLSRRHPPLGYRFTFTDNSITVAKADLRDTRLSGELPLTFQIKNLLSSGVKTVKEIADVLEANEASIKTVVNRMKKRGQLIKMGDSWGLQAL